MCCFGCYKQYKAKQAALRKEKHKKILNFISKCAVIHKNKYDCNVKYGQDNVLFIIDDYIEVIPWDYIEKGKSKMKFWIFYHDCFVYETVVSMESKLVWDVGSLVHGILLVRGKCRQTIVLDRRIKHYKLNVL